MPAKLSVAGVDMKGRYTKGDIISVLPEGGDWGNRQVPPNWVRLEITDATTAQAQQYLEGWSIDFVFTLVNQNASGWRYRVEVDPAVISASGVGKNDLKSEMQSLITYAEPDSLWDGCSTVNFKSDGWTVDIPKNGPYQTATGDTDEEYRQELKADVQDKFTAAVALRRYRFADADVDYALGQPNGYVAITKAQALNKIIDKLED